MGEREGTQLDAFGRFIEHARFGGRPLVQWLRERNWAKFAEGYNGSGFKQNKYDEKLQRAYDAALAEG